MKEASKGQQQNSSKTAAKNGARESWFAALKGR
jgi:hypothetical protein